MSYDPTDPELLAQACTCIRIHSPETGAVYVMPCKACFYGSLAGEWEECPVDDDPNGRT